MVIWLNQLKSKWIVTQDEGEKAGSISESYVDLKTKRVIGFTVKSRGIVGKETWLATDQVKKIGQDVIFIQKTSALMNEKPSGMRVAELFGKSVNSKDGRTLGKLTDVGVHSQNYEFVELAINSNEKIITSLTDLVLGEDLILVQAEAKVEAVPKSAQEEETVISEISELISRHASGMVKHGEDLVKRTSETIKNLLVTPEAKLTQEKKDTPNDSGIEKK